MRAKLLLGTVLAAMLLVGANASGTMQAQGVPDCGKAAVESSPPTQKFLDCNPEFNMALGPGEDPGRRFTLNQAFPDPTATIPTDAQPWLMFNPLVREATDTDGSQQWLQADGYLRAVLQYAFEGNTDVDFDVHLHAGDPTKRQWYHTPWLHHGCFGREFVHGLTRERRSSARELDPLQTQRVDNWAVGFYNAPGGQIVGRVWADPANVKLIDASFPEGTVSFKLLFTTADTTTMGKQVPSLLGSPTWKAHIFPDLTADDCDLDASGAISPMDVNLRKIRDVRLMQIDVAVRDGRAGTAAGIETDWAFGTFIYDGASFGTVPDSTIPLSARWTDIETRLVPVGVTWGTDPDASTDADRTFSGTTATYNTTLRESVINPCVITAERPGRTCANTAVVQHLGLGGRLNGPIDNPRSACMSCHGRSGITADGTGNDEEFFIRGSANPVPTPVFGEFFANIPSGAQIAVAVVEPSPTVIATVVRLDYSLQLRQGIENCMDRNACTIAPELAPAAAPAVVGPTPAVRNRVTRDIP